MLNALPDLWADWCAVTGTPIDEPGPDALELFSRQARPSLAVLKALQPPAQKQSAPAWPGALRGDAGSLQRLMAKGSTMLAEPGTFWLTRLRLRRLLFAAVLVAPEEQGGLALDRAQVRALTPARLRLLREKIGTAADESTCPACAAWSWLELLGTNSTWSRAAVREAVHRRDAPSSGSTHRHADPDPSPGWLDWPDHPNLLPAVDQWGYIDRYGSLHPSSLSVLLRTIAAFSDQPMADLSPIEQEHEPVRPVRHVTAEEEAEILARADALNARIAKFLQEFG